MIRLKREESEGDHAPWMVARGDVLQRDQIAGPGKVDRKPAAKTMGTEPRARTAPTTARARRRLWAGRRTCGVPQPLVGAGGEGDREEQRDAAYRQSAPQLSVDLLVSSGREASRPLTITNPSAMLTSAPGQIRAQERQGRRGWERRITTAARRVG